MNVAMLTVGIEERADVGERRQSVDDELSHLGRETASDSERDRVKSYMSESRAGGALTRTRRQQQCVCVAQPEHREHADCQLFRPQQACW